MQMKHANIPRQKLEPNSSWLRAVEVEKLGMVEGN